jgi:hypothetical protein
MNGSGRERDLELESTNDTSTFDRAPPDERIRIALFATRRAPERELVAALDELMAKVFLGFSGRRLALLPGVHCFTRPSPWPSSRGLVDDLLAQHRAAGLFEAREPDRQKAYFAYDPRAGGKLPVVIRQRFTTSDAEKDRVLSTVEACRTGQRNVVIGGVPVGLLVCGENNVLANVQTEENRVVVRYVGGRDLFPSELKVILNGAHTPMGNWGKMEKRFEWLSRSGRWAFFATNVDRPWGRGELRAYFDGKLVASGDSCARQPRGAEITYAGINDQCRALVIEGDARLFLPLPATRSTPRDGTQRSQRRDRARATTNSVVAAAPESIIGWDGQRIAGARSRGGVFAARDWRHLVISPGPQIEAKARVPSRRATAFDDDVIGCLCEVDGRYSNVQSLNSEDTVTWCTFGLVPADAWIPSLIETALGTPTSSGPWSATLWTRTRHPDTGLKVHGPEADVILRAPNDWHYVVEAKWLQDLDGTQGANRDVTQLDMRAGALDKSADPSHTGVIVVVPGPDLYPFAHRDGSTFRRYFEPSGRSYRALPAATEARATAITWEQIVEILEAPGLALYARYLRWRLNLINPRVRGHKP